MLFGYGLGMVVAAVVAVVWGYLPLALCYALGAAITFAFAMDEAA